MKLTPRIALELIHHEAIVLEAYLDSANVWTWGIGVTDASGHKVARYKDNPQTLGKCIEVYEWLLREKYLPGVLRAFKGYDLSEAEMGAALSFHYNTGAIGRASWVKKVKAGDMAGARRSIMAWNKAGGKVSRGLTIRREKERDLFFDGKWTHDGAALVIPVRKPSYRPDFRAAKRVDIRAAVEAALGGAGGPSKPRPTPPTTKPDPGAPKAKNGGLSALIARLLAALFGGKK